MYKKIYIEITNSCNLKCKFCPQTNRKKEFMTPEQFEIIINKIKDYTKYIYLHVKGEPLIHPQLEELIKIANKNNINVNITTNARLLKDRINIINQNRIRQINISLHSFDNLEEIKELLYTIDKINNVYISLRLWNNNDNKEIINIIENHYNCKIDHQKKENTIKENIFLSRDIEFDWPSLNIDILSKNGTCKGLKDQIGILVDGTVVSCCLDNNGDNNLGNIYNQELKDIIESEKYQSMLKGFNENKLVSPLCQRCGYIKRFK